MLDEETQTFILNNEVIRLGEVETKILAYLIKNRHRRVSSDELADHVYKGKKVADKKNCINVNVFYISLKLKGKISFRNKPKIGLRLRWLDD